MSFRSKIICGIGNIYVWNFISFKNSPFKKSKYFSKDEINLLLIQINSVLSKAVLSGGTTIKTINNLMEK